MLKVQMIDGKFSVPLKPKGGKTPAPKDLQALKEFCSHLNAVRDSAPSNGKGRGRILPEGYRWA